MLTGAPAASPLYRLWRAGRFELLISSYLLSELEGVLDRPPLQPYLRPGAARAFLYPDTDFNIYTHADPDADTWWANSAAIRLGNPGQHRF